MDMKGVPPFLIWNILQHSQIMRTRLSPTVLLDFMSGLESQANVSHGLFETKSPVLIDLPCKGKETLKEPELIDIDFFAVDRVHKEVMDPSPDLPALSLWNGELTIDGNSTNPLSSSTSHDPELLTVWPEPLAGQDPFNPMKPDGNDPLLIG